MNATVLNLMIFGIISALLLLVSRKSLRAVRSHGFYRFFAWEAVLGLTLLNVGKWFDRPASLQQVVSWVLLCASLIVLGFGIAELRKGRRSDIQRDDDTLYGFEKTSVLVTSGIYRYIRHPLYGSLLYLTWGVFFKDVSWYSAGLAIIATLLLAVTAKMDETECVRWFGQAYEEYMRHSEMFIPFIF